MSTTSCKFDIYHTYGVRENSTVKVFATSGNRPASQPASLTLIFYVDVCFLCESKSLGNNNNACHSHSTVPLNKRGSKHSNDKPPYHTVQNTHSFCLVFKLQVTVLALTREGCALLHPLLSNKLSYCYWY